MSKKYQVTELDKVLEQFKGIDEWTDEKQKDWELKRKVESLTSQLEKVNTKKVELYTDNILLKRQIKELETQLQEYRKLQSENDQYWCKGTDENGNKIPMTKVKGSRVMSKEEVEELNKIKLPF